MVLQLLEGAMSEETTALLNVAADPSTTGEQLARLQRNRSRAVRKTVAANPNLPIDQFDTAALGFPESVLENPILDWLLLEDANWLEGLDDRARHRLLCTPTISPTLLWWAARFGTPADQRSVLTNPATPAEIVTWIGEQDTEGHRRVAVQHRAVHADTRATTTNTNSTKSGTPKSATTKGDATNSKSASSRKASSARRKGLAQVGKLAVEELQLLSNHNFSSDAVLLFGCAALPPWIQTVLASADVETRRMLSNHGDATAVTLETLAFDDESDIRARVASRSTLPAETRRLLALLGHLPAQHDTMRADDTEQPAIDPATVVVETVLSDPADASEPLTTSHRQRIETVSAYLEAKFATTEQSLAKRWIAAHPLAPEPLLRSAIASSDWHVREAAASNLTITLPIAALALLDSDKDVRIALALNPACPIEFLTILLTDTNESVRDAASTNPLHNEPARQPPVTQTRRLLTKLSKQTPAIRRLLAQLPNQSIDEQRGFARDEQWEVRLACAANPDADSSVLALLASDSDVDVRRSVAAHKNLGSTTRLTLLSDPQPAVREALVNHADDEALGRLGSDESVTVRAVVAKHPQANAVLLERLGADEDASVREYVAAHPNTPVATRARLAASDEPEVKRAILQWASEPHHRAGEQAQVVTVLLGSNVGDAQTWRRLREGDPTLSRAKLHRLAYATNWGTDSFIGPQTAPKALALLATFNDWRLRQAVAKHPQTPEATIALLTRDSDYDVRTSAAEHPLLRQRDLKRLSADPHFAVRLAVAERADTPGEVLDTMVFDDTDHVREAVLANPRVSAAARALHNGVMFGAFVPQRALTKLASGNSMIRKIIASHPECSSKLRAELAVDDDWRIREAVARNEATEANLLASMASDADRDVRAAVAGHANTPLANLLSLSGDSDHSVRTAVLANPKLVQSQRQACLASAYRRSLISPLLTERLAALLSPMCTEAHLNRRSTLQSPHWIERFVAASHPLASEAVLAHQATSDAHVAVMIRAEESLRTRESERSRPPDRNGEPESNHDIGHDEGHDRASGAQRQKPRTKKSTTTSHKNTTQTTYSRRKPEGKQ
jgi:hypothetical protein